MRLPGCVALTVVAVAALAASVQTPPRDAARRVGTASVSGRVVAADTGAPQPGATVWLSGQQTLESPRTTTDSQGRFSIETLPAGRYLVNVMPGRERTGYLGTSRRFGMPKGPLVDLRDGQRQERVTVALERGSRIAGRVVDDRGEPIARMLVNAVSARGVGAARFALAGFAETDDRGEFRLADLEPGDYVVKAAGIRGGPEGRTGATYLPTFHPGTSNRSEAAVVTVASGDERAGVDIRLVPGRYSSISGFFSGLDTSSAGRTRIVATEIEGGYAVMSAPRPPQPDGSFRITGLTPGEYVVIGLVAGSGPGSIDAVSDPVRIASLDSDVANLALIVSAGVSVEGRVVTASGDAPPFPPDRVEVVALPTGPGQGQFALRRQSAVRADWTFSLVDVHGPFVVRLADLPDSDWAQTAVRLDGRDIADWALDRPTTVEALQLVIGKAGARVSGRVLDADGRPAIHRVVLAFPAEPGVRDVTSLRFRHVFSDEDGAYSFAALAPGDYFVVALDEPFRTETVADRRALDALAPLAVGVSLHAEETKAIDLRLGEERRRE